MRFWLLSVLVLSFLAACAEREQLILKPDAGSIGTPHQIFVATNRAPNSESSGYGKSRSEDLVYQKATVVVPAEHVPGTLRIRHNNPDPQQHFSIASLQILKGESGFETALSRQTRGLPAENRNAMVFVHGFNNSYSEALYRQAQMRHDVETFSTHVNFAWPSAAKVVGYGHDRDSALFSRDALVQTLKATRDGTRAKPFVLAHSMGALLTMEALRQIEIESPGWASKNLFGVALIVPDIDIDVFKSQLAKLRSLPQPFMLFVSERDVALQVSGVISGRPSRLGNDSDIAALADYPILVFDISAFGEGRNTDHFAIATSPALLDFINSGGVLHLLEEEGGTTLELDAGQRRIAVTKETMGRAVLWKLEPVEALSNTSG